jgi:hypothetical protein
MLKSFHKRVPDRSTISNFRIRIRIRDSNPDLDPDLDPDSDLDSNPDPNPKLTSDRIRDRILFRIRNTAGRIFIQSSKLDTLKYNSETYPFLIILILFPPYFSCVLCFTPVLKCSKLFIHKKCAIIFF